MFYLLDTPVVKCVFRWQFGSRKHWSGVSRKYRYKLTSRKWNDVDWIARWRSRKHISQSERRPYHRLDSNYLKLFKIIKKNYNYEFNHHWCWVPNDIPSFWFANSCIQNLVTSPVLRTYMYKLYSIMYIHNTCIIFCTKMYDFLILPAIIHCQTV